MMPLESHGLFVHTSKRGGWKIKKVDTHKKKKKKMRGNSTRSAEDENTVSGGTYSEEDVEMDLKAIDFDLIPIIEDKYKQLREAGINPLLSQHISHIFVRDALVIFDGAFQEVDYQTQTEHSQPQPACK